MKCQSYISKPLDKKIQRNPLLYSEILSSVLIAIHYLTGVMEREALEQLGDHH